MKKALLVLADSRGLSTFPAVYQSAKELKQRDWHVTIVTGSKCDDPSLISFFDKYEVVKSSTKTFLGASFLPYCNLFSKYLMNGEFDIVIAYEPRDAMSIALSTFFKKKPKYIYYNLEVFERKNQQFSIIELMKRLKYWLNKRIEKGYTTNCNYMVIQDEIRQSLSKRNGIFHQDTYLIPNSYYANFENTIKKYEVEKRISILYSGGLERWSISDLVPQLNKLGDNIITLSGWSRDGYLEEVKDSIVNNNNAILLQNTLTIPEYINLVYQNDIGLVWYPIDIENVYFMGRSSGKYFMYLSCGKPVIVRNMPGIADDVRMYKLGVVINSLDELPAAVETIKANYYEYVENVKHSYLTLFDYGIVAKEFFDNLD